MAPAASTLAKPGGIEPSARLVQMVLYGCAPFFGYPWKPILNSFYGGDYKGSYQHFRGQHMDGGNLAMHCLCLVWQLSSNYALLGELDLILEERLGVKRLMTRATTVLWSGHLALTTPTPLPVKLASIASIGCAHTFAGPFFDRHWRRILMMQGALEAVGVQKVLLNKDGFSLAAVWFVIRMLLWKALSKHEGIFKESAGKVRSALVLYMALAGASDKPLPLTIGPMSLFGWIPAMLTGDKFTYFWASGMMATVCQGLAHRIAGEAGTLEVLQEGFDSTKYEFSHVTFFPNLLFQAVGAQLSATRG